MEQTIKIYKNEKYGFDPKWAGKGAWRKISKTGKLSIVAKKELQARWGNPNLQGVYETPTEKTNTTALGGMIKDKAPTPERIKNLTGLLRDPSETVTSAIGKSIKQKLRPEMIMKFLFGPMVGTITGKALNVSPERLAAVSGESISSDSTTSGYGRKAKKAQTTDKIPSTSNEILKEVQLIRKKLYGENTIAVKFSKSSDSYKQLKDIANYFNIKKKEEDVTNNFRSIAPKTQLPIISSKTTTSEGATTSATETSGIFDNILQSFGLGAPLGGGITKVFSKAFGTLKNVLRKSVTKIPIVGPLILAAFGLKDAYDEYMESGNFESAIGTFFQTVADDLTFGLTSSVFGEDGIKNFTMGLINDTKNTFDEYWKRTKDLFKEYITDPIENSYENIKKSFEDFSVEETIEDMKKTFTGWGNKLLTFLDENLITPISNIPSRIFSTVSNAMAGILESVGSITMDFEIPKTAKWVAEKFGKDIPDRLSFKPFEKLLDLAASLRGNKAGATATSASALPAAPNEADATATSASALPAAPEFTPDQQEQFARTQSDAYSFSGEMRDKTPEEIEAENRVIEQIRQTPQNQMSGADFRRFRTTATATGPVQRTTADMIDQQTQALQNNRETSQRPAIVAPVTNNNITNVNQSSQQNMPTASVRNDDSSLMRMQDAMAAIVAP